MRRSRWFVAIALLVVVLIVAAVFDRAGVNGGVIPAAFGLAAICAVLVPLERKRNTS